MKKKSKLFWKDNKNLIYSGIIGLGIGIIITLSFYPERIALLEDGTQVVATNDKGMITADSLYESMKEEYAISALLNAIDTQILTNIYTITEDMEKEIKDTAEYYINMYNTYYDYSEEEFLTSNGFENKQDFLGYLTTDYLRNVYYEEYLKEQITDKQIEKYYKNNVYGDIETKYIAVETDLNDSEGIIEKILKKLKNGSSYEDIIEEYEKNIVCQDLEYQSWNASLDEEYKNALLKLDENSYSKEYITTDYGYTIIFRGKQQNKKSLEEERENIIATLVTELKESDENLYYKSLINMRENNNLIFLDTDLNRKYKAYCNQFNKAKNP